MVADTSAILAILFAESDAERYALAIEHANLVRISVVTHVEIAIIIDRKGDATAAAYVDEFIKRAGIVIDVVTTEHAAIARHAYRNFGKGRHPAALNFGNCFSYALAKAVDEPLLFKGNDFILTDVSVA